MAVALLPIERRRPAFALDEAPAVGEPQRGRRVAAVLDEGEPFAIGDEAIGEREGAEQNLVARALVVPRKAGSVVADLMDAAGIVDPADGRRFALARAATGVSR